MQGITHQWARTAIAILNDGETVLHTTLNPNIATHINFFDLDDMLLGTPEGYIDLNTQKVMAPDPEKMITKAIAIMPNPKAKAPKWLKFLGEAHKGQEDVIPWLQKLAGLSLTGIMKDEMVTYFHGGGGNGKSVFVGALKEIYGDYAKTAQQDAFTMSRSGTKGHSQVIAVLNGARFISASEPQEERVWDMGRVKEWTGNEGAISANLMRQNGEEFIPQGKLVLSANSKLQVARVDAAVRRRFNMVPWPHTPKVVDDTLKNVLLKEEAEGILNWALRG